MEKYGAWGEKNNYGKKTMGVIRSTVLIDPAGKVGTTGPPRKAAGHAEQVRARLAELATNEGYQYPQAVLQATLPHRRVGIPKRSRDAVVAVGIVVAVSCTWPQHELMRAGVAGGAVRHAGAKRGFRPLLVGACQNQRAGPRAAVVHAVGAGRVGAAR